MKTESELRKILQTNKDLLVILEDKYNNLSQMAALDSCGQSLYEQICECKSNIKLLTQLLK